MLLIQLLFQFSISMASYKLILCETLQNDHGAVINLDRQSPGILKEIKNLIMYFRRMPQHEYETEYLSSNSNKENFFLMKEGSDLEVAKGN